MKLKCNDGVVREFRIYPYDYRSPEAICTHGLLGRVGGMDLIPPKLVEKNMMTF